MVDERAERKALAKPTTATKCANSHPEVERRKLQEKLVRLRCCLFKSARLTANLEPESTVAASGVLTAAAA